MALLVFLTATTRAGIIPADLFLCPFKRLRFGAFPANGFSGLAGRFAAAIGAHLAHVRALLAGLA
jgi:hypothetical protein